LKSNSSTNTFYMEHVPVTSSVYKEQILALVEGFKKRTLPATLWTHQAHLITVLWHHHHYSEMEAICFLRSGIIIYNASLGGENTPEKGYHETLTIFWCKILRHFIAANPDLSVEEACRRFLGSEWSSKDLPLKYYTREVLFSVDARAMWIRPNIEGHPTDVLF
jgi:hypothetical protein